MQHFIVDGYNLIHAVPALKNLLVHDPGRAREQLIHAISRLTIRRKFRCTVVFDGEQPRDHPKQSANAPIHVLFAFPLNADAVIKGMIEKARNRSLLVIISSDREIVNFARVCSCVVHTSGHFASLLHEEGEDGEEKSDAPLSPSQLNEWLKIFGEKQIPD